MVSFSPYTPPAFCDGCGDPHRWATRTRRIYQLVNLLGEQDIDEPTRLLVHEDLEQLRTSTDLDDRHQAEIWKRIKTKHRACSRTPLCRSQ